MKLSWIKSKAFGAFILAALLSAPALAAPSTATPGTLNFVEGQASIENQPVTSKSVGNATIEPGQVIATGNDGRVEVLLTPGVFLRLGHNSAVKMVSPSITDTKVQLDKGQAQIDVAEIYKQNNLQVQQGDTTTRMLKKGLYGFSQDPDEIRVFKGQAQVVDGEKKIKVNQGHQLALDSPKLKPARFSAKDDENGLYGWSELRDQYLSAASANVAPTYINSAGWIGPGWYWDPWFAGYTFLPGAGVLYSPFGPWGFYSPAFAYSYGPYLGFGYYGGYYGAPWYGHPYAPYWYGRQISGIGPRVVPRLPGSTPRAVVGPQALGPRVGGVSGPHFEAPHAGFVGGMGGFHGGGFAGGHH